MNHEDATQWELVDAISERVAEGWLARLRFVLRHIDLYLFSEHALAVPVVARTVLAGVAGCRWDLVELSNGGCYARPSLPGPIRPQGPGIPDLSPTGAGLAVSLRSLALRQACRGNAAVLVPAIERLLDYVYRHRERSAICAVLDCRWAGRAAPPFTHAGVGAASVDHPPSGVRVHRTPGIPVE